MNSLQKASMWKRISAFLFDGILFSVVAVLFALILSAALGYDGYNQTVRDCYAKYGEQFGVENMSLSTQEMEALSQEEKDRVNAAYEALNADPEARHAYQMMLSLSLVIISIGLLLAYLTMEFFIPLWLGNGQTLGKKIFGLALMRTDGVKISHVMLFIRTFLGKYVIETMIPVIILLLILMGSLGLLGTVLLLLILVIEIAVMCTTPTRSLIHDLMAGTVAVDFASQMIFDTREAMIAYKEKAHAEMAAKQEY